MGSGLRAASCVIAKLFLESAASRNQITELTNASPQGREAILRTTELRLTYLVWLLVPTAVIINLEQARWSLARSFWAGREESPNSAG